MVLHMMAKHLDTCQQLLLIAQSSFVLSTRAAGAATLDDG
jgi:hypothetical protein